MDTWFDRNVVNKRLVTQEVDVELGWPLGGLVVWFQTT